MEIYLIGFAISLSIIALIEKLPKASVGFFFWSCVALLIPCLIAGLRGFSVGTDQIVYSGPLYEIAANNKSLAAYYASSWLRDGWQVIDPGFFESGYAMLAWICARVFNSYQAFLFLTQALTVVPLYIAMARWRHKYSLVAGVFVYYFLFFPITLNLMRQGISLGFVFLAVIGCYKPDERVYKQILSFTFVLVAFLFHTAAILGVFLILLRRFFECVGEEKHIRYEVIILAVVVAFLLFINVARDLLLAIGVPYRYVNYLGSGGINLKVLPLLFRLPIFVFTIPLLTSKNRTAFNAFLSTTLGMGVVIWQLASLSDYGGRISYYFTIFVCCLPALLLKLDTKKTIASIIVWSGTILYCLVFWYVTYVDGGANATIPYLFYWE